MLFPPSIQRMRRESNPRDVGGVPMACSSRLTSPACYRITVFSGSAPPPPSSASIPYLRSTRYKQGSADEPSSSNPEKSDFRTRAHYQQEILFAFSSPCDILLSAMEMPEPSKSVVNSPNGPASLVEYDRHLSSRGGYDGRKSEITRSGYCTN